MRFLKILIFSVFFTSIGIIEANAQTDVTPEKYLLRVHSEPNILFIGGSGSYVAGTEVTLDKVPAVWQDYEFVGWKVNGMWASDNPISITMNRNYEAVAVFASSEGISGIIIDSIPRVSEITVDGTIYLADELPLSFDWEDGSSHYLSISSIVKKSQNTRYKFDSWKDQSQEAIRTINVDKDTTDFIALYKTQHYLKPISEIGTVLGGGWQDEGDRVNFELESDTIIDKKDENVRYIFNSWDLGDYLNSPSNAIDIEKPISVKANWDKQYQLQLRTNVPDYDLFGTGWYDKDRVVAMIAEENLESPSSDTQYVFDRWVSRGPNPVIIPNAHLSSTTITLSEPYVIEAQYKKSYLVNAWTPYGTANGGGKFYSEGEVAEITISKTTVVVDPSRVKKIFSGWNSHGARVMDFAEETLELSNEGLPGVQNLLVFVDKPVNVTANWKTQYYLNVESSEGAVVGAGWYDLGRLASIKVKSPDAPPSFWTSIIFDKWTGDIESDNSRERVLMSQPKTVIAEWKEDRTAGIINSLLLAGVAAVGILIFAKTRHGKLPLLHGQKAPNIENQSGFEKFFNTRASSPDSLQPTSAPKKNRMNTVLKWLMGREQ